MAVHAVLEFLYKSDVVYYLQTHTLYFSCTHHSLPVLALICPCDILTFSALSFRWGSWNILSEL